MIDYPTPYDFQDLFNHYASNSPKVPRILLAGNGLNMNFGIDTSYENIYSKMRLVVAREMSSGGYEKINITWNAQKLEEVLNPQQDEKEQRTILDCFWEGLDIIIKESVYDQRYIEDFLKNFNKTFIINFDSIIYIARLAASDGHPKNSNDGFFGRNANNDLLWSDPKSQNIFYLHGGFHIIKRGEEIIKLTVGQTGSLSDAIDQYMQENPDAKIECVFRPTSEKKVGDILSNPYMKQALDTLRTIDGVIFLYGVSLDEKDKHIWDTINNNQNIHLVNISYFGDSLDAKYKEFIDRATEVFPNKDVYFFNSQLANIEPPLTVTNNNILGVPNG